MSLNTLPERIRFFIADDVRAESQKPMIIGLFPDNYVGIAISETDPEPTKDKPIVIQSLAILVSFINCAGSFKAKVSLHQPNGAVLIEEGDAGEIKSSKADEKGNVNFVAKFMPFSVPQFGKYKFSLTLDDKKYDFEFEIGRPKAA